MDKALMIITVILIAIVCFIAGMVLELFISSEELKSTRDELATTQLKLADAQRIIDNNTEVIRIEGSMIKGATNDYFKPW